MSNTKCSSITGFITEKEHLTIQETSQILIFTKDEQLTGWNDIPKTRKPELKTFNSNSIRHSNTSHRLRARTPVNMLHNKNHENFRPCSIQARDSPKTPEKSCMFHDTRKIFGTVLGSFTPKLKNLMLINNKAKINKMNELWRKPAKFPQKCLERTIIIHSISPSDKINTSRVMSSQFCRRKTGIPIQNRLREVEVLLLKNFKT